MAAREVVRMLKAYAQETLRAWAEARGIDPRPLTVGGLVEELAEVLLAPAAIRQALAQASPEERIALARLKQASGRMSPPELIAQLDADGVADPNGVIRQVMARGLLFYDRSYEGFSPRWTLWDGKPQTPYPIPFWVPREVLDRVEMPPDLGRLPLERLAEPPAEVREGSFDLVQRDLYLLIQEVRANPVRLLKSGDVGKRDSERLLKVLPAGFAGPGDPTAAARADGSWFPFLWFLIQHAGLTRAEPTRLVISEAGEKFLQQSEGAQARALCRAWLDCLAWHELARSPTLEFDAIGYGDFPSPAQVRVARQTLVEALAREQAYPGWHTLASLVASVRRFRVGFLIPQRGRVGFWGTLRGAPEGSVPYSGIYERGVRPRQPLDKGRDWEKVEGAFLRSCLEEPMLWLGLARLGYEEGRPVAFELTERGAYALGLTDRAPRERALVGQSDTALGRALVVQPNFEVVVYLETAGVPLLVQLDRFAERVRLDRAALYRLTRAALCRGLQEGMTLEEITALLSRHNGGPIPQNVAFTLAEWEQLFQRIRVHRRATLVEAETPEELARLKGRPELAGAREVAPGVLLLPEGVDPKAALPRATVYDYALPVTDALQFESATRFRVLKGRMTPLLRHRLEQVADAGSGDRYVLSREKVARAARGWEWEAMLRFLTDAAREPPGPDLAVTLKGYAGALAPAALLPATILAAPSAAWMDEVIRMPEVARRIARRLSPTLALVAAEDREALDAALDGLGIGIREETDVGAQLAVAARADEEAGETLLVGPPRKRRALIEQAIVLRRQLVIAQMPYGGSRLDTTTLEPVRIEGEGAGAYLYGRTPGSRYENSFPLNRIVGVRMTDETTKP